MTGRQQLRAVALGLCAVFALWGAGGAVLAQDRCLMPEGGQADVLILFDQINAVRLSRGLMPLRPSPVLMIAAQARACAIAAGDADSDARQGGTELRLRSAGCRARAAAEVDDKMRGNGFEVAQAWRDSGVKWRAMTLAGMSEVGIGIAAPQPGQPDGNIWVMAVASGC
jgi:uncharacterized protein YkwD